MLIYQTVSSRKRNKDSPFRCSSDKLYRPRKIHCLVVPIWQLDLMKKTLGYIWAKVKKVKENQTRTPRHLFSLVSGFANCRDKAKFLAIKLAGTGWIVRTPESDNLFRLCMLWLI